MEIMSTINPQDFIDRFWKAIEIVYEKIQQKAVLRSELHYDLLLDELSEWSPDELFLFDELYEYLCDQLRFNDYFLDALRSSQMNILFTDDGWYYFCLGIVALGKDNYYTALRNPNKFFERVIKGSYGEDISREFYSIGNHIREKREDKFEKDYEARQKEIRKILNYIESFEEVITLGFHKTLNNELNSIKVLISPDGRYVISGGYGDGIIKVLDRDQRRIIKVIDDFKELGYVNRLSISSDGTLLACYAGDPYDRERQSFEIKVWSIPKGEYITSLKIEGQEFVETNAYMNPNNIRYLQFHPIKNVLACVLLKKIIFWEVKNNKIETEFFFDNNTVSQISFSFDGIYFVGMNHGDIYFWNYDTGEFIGSFYTNTTGEKVIFSKNMKNIVSDNGEQSIKIWALPKCDLLNTIKIQDIKFIRQIISSPNGKLIATIHSDNTLKVWEIETGNCICNFENYRNSLSSIQFSPDGKYIVSGSFLGEIKIWRLKAPSHLFDEREIKLERTEPILPE
ncbi:MAG: DUF4240 domain-containing protein [Candidatus Thorarchaeota archaeon]